MKKLFTIVFMVIAMTTQAQNHIDPYQPLMEALTHKVRRS